MILKVYSDNRLTETVHLRVTPDDKEILRTLGEGRISTGFQVLMDYTRDIALEIIKQKKRRKKHVAKG